MPKMIPVLCALALAARAQPAPSIAFTGARWFRGEAFEARTVYSAGGRFTFRKPARIDRTIDLSGAWVIPPFGEGHNHNIGTGVEEKDRKAIDRYLADGVFYVKIQGNLPLPDQARRKLGLDVVLAQGSLTATGGHPVMLVEMLLARQGYFPGFTKETLRDNRYFTIDSAQELEAKWPAILALHPDFLKTFLWSSDEFETRRSDPAYFGQRGLDPRILPMIVAKAHGAGLRVSTHVTTAADFHNAVAAGVDEISHVPMLGKELITVEDARLAAAHRTVVDTTGSVLRLLPPGIVPPEGVPALFANQKLNLKLLRDIGVHLAIGSDNVTDSSVAEVDYLQTLGIFDNLALLKMWTEATPRSIFPDRRIGAIQEGYEASFLALEGDPVADLRNTRRIRLRVRQGVLLSGINAP